MKLTSSTIETLTCPSGKKDVTYFDDAMPGFGLRCRGSGVRRYVVQFELNGYTRRITIGAAGSLQPRGSAAHRAHASSQEGARS